MYKMKSQEKENNISFIFYMKWCVLSYTSNLIIEISSDSPVQDLVKFYLY